MQKNYLIAIFTFLLFISGTYISLAQCTEAKDVEMAKYMKLTKNQDAQGCSHCGLLAMYFCSAKYCATPEDIKQVGAMIDACKKNILTMGKPYCCPDYLDKQPEWGSMVNSQTQGTSSNVSGSNPVMQNNNFLTTEDGINKLINNPAFIQDVLKLGTEELTLENIDKYMADYVPEYANFKIKNKIDINKIYYANSEDVASDVIADNLGSLFKMNGAQTETLKNAINGNLSYVPTSNLSTGLGNSLYERGKDKKVDYGVDYAVDFFQQKMGDGGVNSALIDMGGGLLGGLATDINKRYEEKMAKEAILYKALEEQNLFLMGETKVSLKGKKLGKEHTPDQQDLIIHNQANSKVPSLYAIGLNTPDYEQAIQLYSKAIDIYKQKPERAYFLYIAFAERAKAKMQIGAYKAAIIDYYFAEEVLEKILNGQLPDKSVKSVYPVGYFDSGNKKKYLKGKVEFTLGALSQDDKAVILIGRAFAKYRLMDYTGSIADCNLAFKAIVMTKNQTAGNNSYRDFTTAIVAMSKFGLGDYNEAYALFSGTNITDEIIDDIDNDGIIDFLDPDEKGLPMYTDTYEGLETFNFYGLPNYFAFDIIQVKGLTYYKTKHIDEAIALYDKLIASENESTKYIGTKKMFTRSGGDIASVYASLSSFHFEKKDNAKALDYINDALNYDPGRKEYVQKKALYSKTPDLEKASGKATVKKTKKPVADKKAAAKQNSLKATAATTEKTTEKKISRLLYY